MLIRTLGFISILFLSATTLSASDLTTLRVVGKPKGTHGHSQVGQPFLTAVEVEVRNAGRIDAQNIQVIATLPNDQRVTLEGPSSIAPNKKALYTKNVRIHNPPQKQITAEARCDNCRN